jgi:O-antigen ligase
VTNASSAGRGAKIIRLAYLVGGVVWLAVSLLPRGATLIYLWPWPLVLTLALAVPPLVLLFRLAVGGPVPRLGGLADWAVLALLLAHLAAALLSPFRAASLGMLLLPVAGLGLLYELQVWRRDDPAADEFIARAMAWLLVLFTTVSLVMWLALIAWPNRFQHLWEARNPHPLGHSNYTAGVLLLLLPFGLARLREHRSRVGWGLAVAAAIFCLFTAGSRAALLGLAAGGATAGLLLVRSGLWSKRRALQWLAVGAIGVAIFAASNPRVRELLHPAPGAIPDDSTIQRGAMIHAGELMIGERPFLGWGPGTTPLVYPRFRRDLSGGVDTALQLHNAPLQLAVDTGVTGLAAMLLLLGAAAWSGWRACLPSANPGRWPVAAIAGVALAAYGVFALYDFELDVPFFPVAGAICLALLLSRPSAESALPRWLALPVLAAALGLAVMPKIPELRSHALLAHAADALENNDPGAFHALALQASTVDPDDTEALNAVAFQLGERAQRENDPAARSRLTTEAENRFAESLNRNPDQEICETNLAWLLLSHDPALAEKHLLAAANLVPEKEGLGVGLARVALAAGRRDAAVDALAVECLIDPHFLVSPSWNDPANPDLRGPVLTAVHARATAMASEISLAPWQRAELLYLAGFADWLNGKIPPGAVVPVALDAAQRAFFGSDRPGQFLAQLAAAQADDIVLFRSQRPGYGVLMRNLDAPMPVDFYEARHYRLVMTEGAFLLPERLHLPGRLLLAEFARAVAVRP